jgi:putative flavoprotein involved in K+ transport
MTAIDTVVIGAGHAGLAVSHLLTRARRDHVVLDRGRVAESWRSERWDSLRLLTPRWMTRLPGWRYRGPDQEGFMAVPELVAHLEAYAAAGHAPLSLGEEVLDVSLAPAGFRVRTTAGTWRAGNVVVATGPGGRPHVPATVERLDPGIHLLPSSAYRNPGLLPPGGVLVVGAAASGTQIADELARAGRRVVLAVGRHTRMPRRYRGMDVFWWLERTGRLGRRLDPGAAPRREPSLQLAGREPSDPRGEDVDLGTLQTLGDELTGRLAGVNGHRVDLAPGLATATREADARLARFLDEVAGYVDAAHLAGEVEAGVRPRPVRPRWSPTRLDLRAEGIGTVLLATGQRPHHPWLRVPVVDDAGRIRQVRGVTPVPGLYVVGQPFQHRRDATFIDGARHGARDVVTHLCSGELAGLERADLP